MEASKRNDCHWQQKYYSTKPFTYRLQGFHLNLLCLNLREKLIDSLQDIKVNYE